MFCEKCGKPIEPNAKFCTACGAANRALKMAPNAAAAPVPPYPPQGYPQNMPGQMPPYGARKSSGGKTAVIIVAIVAVVLIVLAALFVLYIKLRTTTPPIDPPVQQTEQAAPVQPNPDDVPQEAVADEPQEMTYAQAQQAAASYSTEERPNLGTFTWYEPYIGKGTAPDFFDAAAPVTNHTLVEGGWKMLIVWDPNRITNSYCWNLCNAQIWNRGGDSVALNVNYYVNYDPDMGVSSDATNQPTACYAGSWLYDSFHTTVGYSDIDITYFYTFEGRQYAIGSATSPDGTVGEVALVRP